MVTLSCSDGSAISGPDYGFCYGSDIWNPDITIATCPVPCGPPAVGSGGVITTPDKTSYDGGDVVQFSCPLGSITGPPSATCDTDGSWFYDGTGLPSCPAPCAAPDNTNGTGMYGSGEVLLFQCLPGYCLPGWEDTVTTICDYGTWTPPVVCVSTGCPVPEVPEGVSYRGNPTDGFLEHNERVDLECDDDKTPIGPEYSYCKSTNQWDPDPMLLQCYDKCQIPSFDDVRLVHKSTMTGESMHSTYNHRDTVEFLCEEDLYLHGTKSATCSSGTWSFNIGGPRPACRANCTGPVNTDVVDELFRHGEVHIFQCVQTPGMVRLGGPRAFCDDGAWKPNVRCAYENTCVRPSLNTNVVISPDQASYPQWMRADVSCSDGSDISGPTYGLCYGSDTWNPDITTSTCTSVSCGPPNVGDGGVITAPDQTSYDPGNKVQFSCPQGGVTGPPSATCDTNGSWNYEGTGLPSCQAACAAPDNTNGTGIYGSGEVVVFRCLSGYSLPHSGDTVTTTCDDGEWNPDVACDSTGCPEPEVPDGVTYDGDPEDEYFEHNQRELKIRPLLTQFYTTGSLLLDKCQTPIFNDTRVIHTSKLTGEAKQEQIMYDHTDTILFSCEGELFVDGPWRIVCNEGTWSGTIGGDLPVCRANCTGPDNSDVAGELFRHGEVHTFQCAQTTGMVRLGGPRAFCNDGTWKPRIRCALKTEL
ncbi:complement factor H-like [Diadema setosum]|uniref:complement factor H-like n=1 Tax=Diadema setosum TaxID=31175 RepID=UPI003B3ADCA3